jgi:hypothetical protein
MKKNNKKKNSEYDRKIKCVLFKIEYNYLKFYK